MRSSIHKIEIRGKEWSMWFEGTVGLMFLAQQLLGTEIDANNRQHHLALYYAALQSSNETAYDMPSYMAFLSAITVDKLKGLEDWFWSEWKRIEPKPDKNEEDEKDGKAKKV